MDTQERKRTWMSFVISFPKDFVNKEKHACASLFNSSDRVIFEPISPAYDFENSMTIEPQELRFSIKDTLRRDAYTFLKHLHNKAMSGGIHSIGYGYPSIGVDILCIELATENNQSVIVDAFLIKNAVPNYVRNINEEKLEVQMLGFFSSNDAVMTLADNFIKAQVAAQQEKIESPE